MSDRLTTIECSRPHEPYTLLHTGHDLDVHLAAGTPRGGVGPCLCGFDRHARDETGRTVVGFSVGGGVTGPSYTHRACQVCARMAVGKPIAGLHAALFATAEPTP